jgi:hypothetical protein
MSLPTEVVSVSNQLTTAPTKAYGGVDVWTQELSTFSTSFSFATDRLGDAKNQSGRRAEVRNLDPENGSRAPFLICFHGAVSLGLFLDREDGGHMFLRNVR